MKKLFVFILLASSSLVVAGDRIGNGGDVIVCPDQKTILLDLFQGSDDWGFGPLPRQGKRDEIIAETLSEFSIVDPVIAGKFLRRAIQINDELTKLETGELARSDLVKLTKNELVNIPDEGVAELPLGCKIVQAAIQNQSTLPGEVKFTFQRDTWLSMESDTQASLILHEVIYEHMIYSGELASRSTRYLNASLHAGVLNSVLNYFKISTLFSFRNMDIVEDGPVRFFGAKKLCSVRRKWFDHSSDFPRGGTTIMVGRRNITTSHANYFEAMQILWNRHVSKGACD